MRLFVSFVLDLITMYLYKLKDDIDNHPGDLVIDLFALVPVLYFIYSMKG